MGSYSVFNNYEYAGKGTGDKILDTLSTPVRLLLNGRNINLITKKNGATSSTAEKIIAFIAAVIFFPVGLVATLCLALKKLKDKSQVPADLIRISDQFPVSRDVSPIVPTLATIFTPQKAATQKRQRQILQARHELNGLIQKNPELSANLRSTYNINNDHKWTKNEEHPLDYLFANPLSEEKKAQLQTLIANKHFRQPHNNGNLRDTVNLTIAAERDLDVFQTMIQRNMQEGNDANLNTLIYPMSEHQSLSCSLIQFFIETNNERGIDLFLESGGDVNLLLENTELGKCSSLSPGCQAAIQRLSPAYQEKIKQALEVNALESVTCNSYCVLSGPITSMICTPLEKAVIQGNLEQVNRELERNACVNHDRGRPLRLACEYYSKAVLGTSPSEQVQDPESEEMINTRKQIAHLLLNHPKLRIKETYGITAPLYIPQEPADVPGDWDVLLAKKIARGADFTEGLHHFPTNYWITSNYIKKLPTDSPLFQAMTPSQKAYYNLSIEVHCLEAVLNLGVGSFNQPTHVYRAFQEIWSDFKASNSLNSSLSANTVSTLSRAIDAIPTLFREEDADNLLAIYNENVPLILPSGWGSEASVVVFHGNQMITGVVGEARAHDRISGLIVYEFDRSKLTAEHLKRIVLTDIKPSIYHQECSLATPYALSSPERDAFDNSLIEALRATKIREIPLPERSRVHSAWSSSAVLGLLSSVILLSEDGKTSHDDASKDFVYKEFEPFARFNRTEAFITHFKAALANAWIHPDCSHILHPILINTLKMAISKGISPSDNETPEGKQIYQMTDMIMNSGLPAYNPTEQPRLHGGWTLQPSQEDHNWIEKRYGINLEIQAFPKFETDPPTLSL